MNQDSLNLKNNLERKQCILFAALSGFIAGTTTALVSSFINIWPFPDLPLHLEWSPIFFVWGVWVFLGGLLAGVAAHYFDGYTILCTIVLYPGRDPSIYPCKGQTP